MVLSWKTFALFVVLNQVDSSWIHIYEIFEIEHMHSSDACLCCFSI